MVTTRGRRVHIRVLIVTTCRTNYEREPISPPAFLVIRYELYGCGRDGNKIPVGMALIVSLYPLRQLSRLVEPSQTFELYSTCVPRYHVASLCPTTAIQRQT